MPLLEAKVGFITSVYRHLNQQIRKLEGGEEVSRQVLEAIGYIDKVRGSFLSLFLSLSCFFLSFFFLLSLSL